MHQPNLSHFISKTKKTVLGQRASWKRGLATALAQSIWIDTRLLELGSLGKNGTHVTDGFAVDVVGNLAHPFGLPTDEPPVAPVIINIGGVKRIRNITDEHLALPKLRVSFIETALCPLLSPFLNFRISKSYHTYVVFASLSAAHWLISGEFESLLPIISFKLINQRRETLYPKEERSQAGSRERAKTQ